MDEQGATREEVPPMVIRASGGATVNVTITINKYFLDVNALKRLWYSLCEDSPTSHSFAMTMARSEEQ
jgi:hypothetical protein